ncbi:MAG: hypothetical protein PHS93_04685 [Candidatus Omnitrophica bacterium]|nr:hypothetical protein [Candidatus Omnitrophota bacterium]MDD5352448.1 hypothetical protein [Candidatus Omnitrophota bacterium]MDD5550046.1 hypothetical protein [Candidatus Omnitrophota bacterium]
MRKNTKQHIIYFITFLVILFVFTFPLVFKMDKAVYGPLYGTDNRAAIWHFWWFNYSAENNLNVDTNVLTNYPFGVKYMAPQIFPLCMIPAYLFSVIFNEIFAYNALILGSFILSFLCMYALVFYLTKRHSAAFISGLIYTFSPYHINKSWEHFGLMFIEFIPLYILFLLKLKDKPNISNLIFCSLSLTLVILSDLTYSYIIFIFSVLYILFCVFYYLRNRYPVKEFSRLFINFFTMGILSLLMVLPLLMPSIKAAVTVSHSNDSISAAQNVAIRSFHYLFTQSASILAYLIPSKYHPLWGGLARSLEGSIFFGRGSIEQTLYLGWVGLILSFIAIRRRENVISHVQNYSLEQTKFVKQLFLFIFISAVLISMPPYWNLLFFKIYFPSFFLYKVFPVFRAYARFGVLSVLSISILAGYGFNSLMNTKHKHKFFIGLFSFLILLDFANIPPSRVTEIDKCPPVYSWLGKQKEFFVIAEYPLTLGDMAEGYINLDNILYQRFHRKAIIEGSEPGTLGSEIKKSILRITDPATPKILSALGVKYVILHLNDYLAGNNKEAIDVVGETPDLSKSKDFKFINKFDNDEVYEIVANH